jgi:hypothetical protein
MNAYLLLMISHTLFTPFCDLEEACHQFGIDINTIIMIEETCYLNGQHPVPRAGNLHLAWQYAQDPDDHHQFIHMLHVTPLVFFAILQLIEDHPIFVNHSNNGQTPVEQQLAVTLYWMGCYSNAASVEDVTLLAGCGEGSVVSYTN